MKSIDIYTDEYFKENKNNAKAGIGIIVMITLVILSRHVPRKRPELALKAVVNLDLDM